jgi:hypothetical protein
VSLWLNLFSNLKIRKVGAKTVPTGKPEQTILECLDQRVVNITEFGLLKNLGKRKTSA